MFVSRALKVPHFQVTNSRIECVFSWSNVLFRVLKRKGQECTGLLSREKRYLLDSSELSKSKYLIHPVSIQVAVQLISLDRAQWPFCVNQSNRFRPTRILQIFLTARHQLQVFCIICKNIWWSAAKLSLAHARRNNNGQTLYAYAVFV